MLNNNLRCDYPCPDVNKDMIVPGVNIAPELIRIVMISEAPPLDHSDYFYQDPEGFFFQTTKAVFHDADIEVDKYEDLTRMGIYLTTAIKCSKVNYLVSTNTIKECSMFLAKELDQFRNIKIIMCMGDFAIKAVNYIYKSRHGIDPIKPGSTYKIRKENYLFNGIKFMPSYTQTGDSFNLEKSKRCMIAEDIKNAFKYLKEMSF